MSKFCIHCGTVLADQAMFCSACGTRVADDIDNVRSCNMNISKDNVIEGLQACRRIFAPLQAKYDVRNDLQVFLNQKPPSILGILAVCFLIGVIIVVFIDAPVFAWVIGSVSSAGLILWLIKKKQCNSAMQLSQVNSELEDHYKSRSIPVKLAFEYSDPRIIDMLIDILKKGRADTLKEAINCMLDDQYKAETLKATKENKPNANVRSLLALGILLSLNKD